MTVISDNEYANYLSATLIDMVEEWEKDSIINKTIQLTH